MDSFTSFAIGAIIFIVIIGVLSIGIVLFKELSREEKMKILNNYSTLLSEDNEPAQLTYDRKTIYTKELLEFIDNLITIEIINATRFDLLLDNSKPNKIDADKTIESVATSVFDALKPDIFIGKDCILKEDYLMKYIQKKTFIVYISYIKENVSSQL